MWNVQLSCRKPGKPGKREENSLKAGKTYGIGKQWENFVGDGLPLGLHTYNFIVFACIRLHSWNLIQ